MTRRNWLGPESRAINSAIVSAVEAMPGITRAEVAQRVGQTSGCVAQRIRRLIDMGVLESTWRGAPFPAKHWIAGGAP